MPYIVVSILDVIFLFTCSTNLLGRYNGYSHYKYEESHLFSKQWSQALHPASLSPELSVLTLYCKVWPPIQRPLELNHGHQGSPPSLAISLHKQYSKLISQKIWFKLFIELPTYSCLRVHTYLLNVTINKGSFLLLKSLCKWLHDSYAS